MSGSGYAQETAAPDTASAGAILRSETAAAREQWRRRQILLEHILTQAAVDLTDSTLSFRWQRQPINGLDKSQLADIPPEYDYIGERLRREDLELPPLVNLNDLIGAGVKSLTKILGGAGVSDKKFTVIPSALEVDVLKVLWKENEATASGIYTHLDSMRLTAADLDEALTLMTERGLVERQQISPRNEFTVFGVAAIEMSARNRKNREFIYRPKISRQTMLTFLDATAFSYRLASASNHSLIDAHLHKLMNKLVATNE